MTATPPASRVALYAQLGLIRRGPKVRAKLDEVADRLESRARQLGDPDDAGQIGREDGVRPKGRPYARVTATVESEFGSATAVRKRMLGRAVAEFASGTPDPSE